MTSGSKQGQNPHLLGLPPPPLIMSVLSAQSQHRFNAIVFGLRGVQGKTPAWKNLIYLDIFEAVSPTTTTTIPFLRTLPPFEQFSRQGH